MFGAESGPTSDGLRGSSASFGFELTTKLGLGFRQTSTGVGAKLRPKSSKLRPDVTDFGPNSTEGRTSQIWPEFDQLWADPQTHQELDSKIGLAATLGAGETTHRPNLSAHVRAKFLRIDSRAGPEHSPV